MQPDSAGLAAGSPIGHGGPGRAGFLPSCPRRSARAIRRTRLSRSQQEGGLVLPSGLRSGISSYLATAQKIHSNLQAAFDPANADNSGSRELPRSEGIHLCPIRTLRSRAAPRIARSGDRRAVGTSAGDPACQDRTPLGRQVQPRQRCPPR